MMGKELGILLNQETMPPSEQQAYVLAADFQALKKRCEKLEAENRELRREDQALQCENQAFSCENAELRKQNQALKQENHQLRQENQALREEINALRHDMNQLKEWVKLGQLARFGKQSEVGETICSSTQTESEPPSNEIITVVAHTRKSPTSTRNNKN
jgi:predicted nuclease with TOPRIM domain